VVVLIDRTYRWAVPALTLWLTIWIVISWAGVQDDAFIHLRYADNLSRTHLITYDGVHPNYGASSLLYVYLLSFFRAITSSPTLPRFVSSCVHLALFAGLILLFRRAIPREFRLARLLGLIMLVILVAPSSIRWLDDGMETGLGLCFVALLCWVVFRQSTLPAVTGSQYLALVALGFFSVLLRTEFILLCTLSIVILVWQSVFNTAVEAKRDWRLRSIASRAHLLIGGTLALTFIRIKMHFLLPDTALAKAAGTLKIGNLPTTAYVLAGALSFGAGMFLFWLITIFLLSRARRLAMADLFANSAFPILLALAVIRGQQIQGARYFEWAIFFSVLWNILELGRISGPQTKKQLEFRLAYAFFVFVLVMLPVESVVMYSMLKARSTLLQHFESDHFERLEGKRGVAFDVGLIGYFSRANICDLAGLVNGREKARETTPQRVAGCLAGHPDFLFIVPEMVSQIIPSQSFNDWQVCSPHYDYKNVNTWNSHYLIVPRATASEVCREVSNSTPFDLERLQLQ
jgi:hypothetical protein